MRLPIRIYMFIRILFFFLIYHLLVPAGVVAQDSTVIENILIVRKVKSSKRFYYPEKSSIIYQTKDSTYFGIIQKIENDSLLIDSTWTQLNDITSITNPYSRGFLKKGSVMFPIAGIAFLFITTINAVINNERPIFYFENIVPSAGLVGLGLIMWPFKTQKFNLNKKWELIVMPS